MFLIIDTWMHPKNRNGLIMMLNELNYEFKFGTENDLKEDKWKIVYNPSEPMDISLYPNKFWIFGPHFSVFPNEKFIKINYKQDNLVYIHPSEWCVDVYKKFNLKINLKVLTFAVDINKFNFIKPINERTEIIIYYKSRKTEELEFIVNNLQIRGINNFRIFSYRHKYNEEDFLNYLHNSKYGIIVDAHESQGFAIQEMLSCNIPLLVWNVSSLNQEEGSYYDHYSATTIPYWDNRCGEYFYNKNEFDEKYKLFMNNLEKYKPREFILDNLSAKQCAKRLKIIVGDINT
jgi:hypothetical protein